MIQKKTQDTNSKMMLVKPKKMANKTNLTPEFYEWLNEVEEKYEDVIKELAQKLLSTLQKPSNLPTLPNGSKTIAKNFALAIALSEFHF